MCGIFGWIAPEVRDTPELRASLHPALDALRPRGPDGSGVEVGEGWVLGHTRLAILDLTDRAAQPMGDGRGGWLTYNGEIYNFRELGKELEGRGVVFRSTGDSEVLLQALREWGPECLPRLRGMFAFGWWDERRRRLLLARDRYGVKPLAYRRGASGLQFASDLFGLRAMPWREDEVVDAGAAMLYMALGYVPAPHTIIEGSRKVMPGGYLECRWDSVGGIEVREVEYSTLASVPAAARKAGNRREEASAGEEYERRARESIEYRLISDVPVGVLLSGGIDSSLTTALTGEVSGGRVPSFTMGFDDPEADESVFARPIAERLGGSHREFRMTVEGVLGVWDRIGRIYDEPFADASALPMVALCESVVKHVKVAVSGDGGDETACGYSRHWAMDRFERAARWPRSLRRVAAAAATAVRPGLAYRAEALRCDSRPEVWMLMRTGLHPRAAGRLPVTGADPSAVLAHFESTAARVGEDLDPLDWACRMDLASYMPDDLMVKADRASMAVGLELREPFLDHGLTTWLLELPLSVRVDLRARQSKRLMRMALAKRVPAALFERPKQGFTPPLAEWLRGPMRDVVADAVGRFDGGALAPLAPPRGCRRWEECSVRLGDVHQQYLWRLLCFARWLDANPLRSGNDAS